MGAIADGADFKEADKQFAEVEQDYDFDETENIYVKYLYWGASSS